jgi:hypothetical protein
MEVSMETCVLISGINMALNVLTYIFRDRPEAEQDRIPSQIQAG